MASNKGNLMSRELWIVTGLSGAGKSLALKSLEDLGFWCVDNLPCALMKPYIELEARKDVDANTWAGLEPILQRAGAR